MIEYVDMVVGGMVGAWENTFCAVLIGIGQASFIYMYWHVCQQKNGGGGRTRLK